MKTINIGLIGFGTVGRGVFNILNNNIKIYKKLGLDIKVNMICVKDINKDRNFDKNVKIPLITDNYLDIMENKEINMIVEVMGGIDIPFEIYNNSIKYNKASFITANKALVANKIKELKQDNEMKIGFEAAVCGGIPIISTLKNFYLSDPVSKVSGIVNGTTNFILTKMEKESLNYENVLKEAQDLGFAEEDPSADVLGIDASSKISIISNLISGIYINTEEMYVQGINKITERDFKYAHYLNSTIKHLAITEIDTGNNSLSSYVIPTLVSNKSPIANVEYENNTVEITSKYSKKMILTGKGAGMEPTALSVVNDIINIATDQNNNSIYNSISTHSNIESPKFTNIFSSNFLIRMDVNNEIGIIESVGRECKNVEISIDAILQHPQCSKDYMTFAITTEKTCITKVKLFVENMKKYKFYKDSNILNILDYSM